MHGRRLPSVTTLHTVPTHARRCRTVHWPISASTAGSARSSCAAARSPRPIRRHARAGGPPSGTVLQDGARPIAMPIGPTAVCQSVTMYGSSLPYSMRHVATAVLHSQGVGDLSTATVNGIDRSVVKTQPVHRGISQRAGLVQRGRGGGADAGRRPGHEDNLPGQIRPAQSASDPVPTSTPDPRPAAAGPVGVQGAQTGRTSFDPDRSVPGGAVRQPSWRPRRPHPRRSHNRALCGPRPTPHRVRDGTRPCCRRHRQSGQHPATA
jgi:hypothetical protein